MLYVNEVAVVTIGAAVTAAGAERKEGRGVTPQRDAYWTAEPVGTGTRGQGRYCFKST